MPEASQKAGVKGLSTACGAQVIFMLPDTYPIDLKTINYSPLAVGVVLIVLLATWFWPRLGARHWFRGKAHTLDDQKVVCWDRLQLC